MPKRKNAFGGNTQNRLAELFTIANKDDNVKCVLLHGGEYFSSGNDLSAFASQGDDPELAKKNSRKGLDTMVRLLTSMWDLEKPLVVLVRGAAYGIACTMIALADFIYCTPEAVFCTPFMGSFQSPEGGSTYLFPQQMGKRMASEMLLLDKIVSSEDAYRCGFINEIIPKLSSPFNPMEVPCIPKLLSNDLKTMVNCKVQINKARGKTRA
jgi:enoyl-CoA hydratase/carnithine racemase